MQVTVANFMWEDLTRPSVIQTVVWVAVTLIVSAIAWQIISSWRDRNREGDTDSDVLTNLRELHERGVLDEKEFRTIKTQMGDRLRNDS